MACGLVGRPPYPSASRDGPEHPSRASLLVTLLGGLAAYPTLSGPFVGFRSLDGSRWPGMALLVTFDVIMVVFRALGGGDRGWVVAVVTFDATLVVFRTLGAFVLWLGCPSTSPLAGRSG